MPDTQTVAARVDAYLRGRFPRDTAKLAALVTGLPAATIAKWLTRSSAPSAGALLTCVAAFGPEFLTAVCPGLAWVEVALSATRSAALRQALDRQDAELQRTVALLRGDP